MLIREVNTETPGATLRHTHLAQLGQSSSARHRRNSSRSTLLTALAISLLLTVVMRVGAQTSRQAQSQNPTQAAPPPSATATAAAAGPAPTDPAQIIHFLDQVIAWHRQLGAQEQIVSDVNDSVYVSSNRQMAGDIVRLAFQFARTKAVATLPPPTEAQPPSEPGTTAAAYQTLRQQEAEALKDLHEVEGEVQSLQKKL